MSKDSEYAAADSSKIHGYPSFATIIASDPTAAIYRRFGSLSARTLLYMQSELAELESKLGALEHEDLRNEEDGGNEPHRDWKLFEEKAEEGGRWGKRMDLVMEIRKKLKAYQEALLVNSKLLSVQPPSKQAYKALNNVFNNVDKRLPSGDTFTVLEGNSSTLYENPEDLLALREPAEEDRLSKFLRTHCSILFCTKKPASAGGYLAYISEDRIRIVVGTVNVLLAAAFLFGAIYNLYYVQNEQKRLGLITAYTIAFATCIGLLTNARRPEIFGASAAYAAVLVVFVSGGLATRNSNTCTPCPSPGVIG